MPHRHGYRVDEARLQVRVCVEQAADMPLRCTAVSFCPVAASLVASPFTRVGLRRYERPYRQLPASQTLTSGCFPMNDASAARVRSGAETTRLRHGFMAIRRASELG